ncbi:hypothetical protein GCM10010156_37180 [Planobispora rosea]|uniref:Prepilin-type N-terminal cleavage/methylation domain-containing protein n=1 Tax=Planobispora rosea TaxID=35762 RepID=A0A8J3S178_PLARO|nr:prepilin-type N-terminal cleavage/methylation domain-containing protein [Planobispora rosea]GGS74931.1 hypothetical protein GCM10010156_37180 [Planobispora rosea]GIH81793.1 hypothetical protein Pro02_02010 [Planobispora rosea]
MSGPTHPRAARRLSPPDRLRAARAVRATGDAGVSLIEVLVTMGIMSVLMAIFTAGIVQVYRVVGSTESLATAQEQMHVAFQRLDREIRYASWIGEPGTDGDYWYVEFAYAELPDKDATTLTKKCGQLRLDLGRGVLQLLRWTPGSPSGPEASRETLASHIATDVLRSATATAEEKAENVPFERILAGSEADDAEAVGADFVPDFQRLRIHLTAEVGDGDKAGSTELDATFTALNTSRNTELDNTCEEGRP